jgi:GT2 family glycosyltransferase
VSPSAPSAPRVVAVVVNWNGAADLPDCLAALRAQTRSLAEVVVVDNASTDDSRRVLEAATGDDDPVPVRVVWNATNRGFAGGANDGLASTHADAWLVANPDVRPDADYLAHALDALLADDRRGAVQGRLHRTAPSPTGAPVVDTTGHLAFTTRLFRNRGEGEVDRGQWDTPGEVFGVSGALALYRATMLDDVAVEVAGRDGRTRREVFDEDLFAFWEDVDLDWRAAMRGWATWYEPRAVARHERGGAGPRRTARVEQLNWQNRLLTLVKDDTWTGLRRGLPGLVVTTVLKTCELALTAPSALVGALRDWRLVGVMLRKRRAVHDRATVPSPTVVDRWFIGFDYAAWVRTWWRRVRGVPVGHEPRGDR